MEIARRFLRDPGGSFFLFGPRGSGKSTWLGQVFPGERTIDLLDPGSARRYEARPERIEEVVAALEAPHVVIIDEVQKVPRILDAVHRLMEKHRHARFVLTGSSTRKLKRAGVDLLAGRALLRTMHPFMAAELGHGFNLDAALSHGLLPVVVDSEKPSDTLESYVGLHISEEVRNEGYARRYGAFNRFLEAVSLSHATVLNVTNVARECHVERKSVEGDISILEDMHLAFRVPVFRQRAKRAVTSHPKLYLSDAGVFRAMRPVGPYDVPAERDGAALEGLVMQHLRAWTSYRGKHDSLSFWRTASGVEVDAVVHGDDGFWAIEVKNHERIGSRDLRPLRSFEQDHPTCRPLLLYRGTERLVRSGILCMPCEQFLLRLHPDKTIAEVVEGS